MSSCARSFLIGFCSFGVTVLAIIGHASTTGSPILG